VKNNALGMKETLANC